MTDCNVYLNYTLYIDNVKTIKLTNNPEFHERSKYIDVRYHFIRDIYNKGEIDINYLKAKNNVTKQLQIYSRNFCRN